MSSHQMVTSPIQNSTCRHVGHEWKSGLDPDFHTCTRLHCRAAQRFVHGTWIDASRPLPSRKSQPVTSSSPLLLWSSRPSSADLVRDRELERHYHELEQRYYKAVVDEQIYRATLTRRQRGAS